MNVRSARLGLLAVVALLVLTGCTSVDAETSVPRTGYDSELHQLLPPHLRNDGVLRIATDASYPPASFFDTDGRTVVGFEPDMADAIARTLGVEVDFVVMGFDDTLQAVESGEVDLVMSSMTDTPERERLVDFVNYFSAGTSIVVQRGNPFDVSDLDDLCGRIVAVETATVQVDLIARYQAACDDDPIVVHQHSKNSDALLELRTGRAAAVLNDYPPAAYLASDPRTQADFELASQTQFDRGLYGIAVARDRPRLGLAVTTALSEVHAAGEYGSILEQWDVSDGGIARISLNGGG